MKAILFALLLAALPALAQQQNPLTRLDLTHATSCALEEPQPLQPFVVNGWNATDVGGSNGTFYRDANCVVHLEGLVYRFTYTSTPGDVDEVAFVLPQGYRPRQYLYFTVQTETGPSMLTAYPSGEVRVTGRFTYFGWVSTAGVTFRSQ